MRALETGEHETGKGDEGYAMMALLAMMAVMAIMMTAAVPVWKTSVTREKEAELIFRGQQYARAIGLYQRKLGPGTLPPSIDVLVDQKFLRKKYKDPITNDDFQLLSGAQAGGFLGQQPGQQPGQQGRGQQGQGQTQQGQQPGARGGIQTNFQFGSGGGPAVGGIMGVVSKSTETSMRLYNNRSHYNEWTFVFVQQQQAIPGGAGGGAGGRGRGGTDGRGGANPPGARPGGASPFGPGAGGGGAGRGPGTPQPFGIPGPQGPQGGRGRGF